MSFVIKDKPFQGKANGYKIMHRDKHVATIRSNGSCTIYYPSYMPYNLYLEKTEASNFDTALNNLNNFYYWCASRVLTLDRKYAKEILNNIGATQANTDMERSRIAISYRGLSLTDVFWIADIGERISFDEISLFNHSLSDAMVDLSLRGRALTVQNTELISIQDVAGEVSAQGLAPKAWIRGEDTFYLLKNGNARDVKAELLASQIVSCFDVDQVKYEKSEFENKLVSKSRIITSEDYSIAPMEYMEIFFINNDIDTEEYVKKTDAHNYYMMNIIDYLIGNSDRHWGNWGFLIDNKTNKPIRLHPLMDFNKAFTEYNTIDGGKCLTTFGRSITQREAAIEAVKEIGLNQIRTVNDSWFYYEKDRSMFNRRLKELVRYCK